jgi:hypothetical protein
LRQGNIKLLVASWAPLRYYFSRPAEVSVGMGEWATVNFCPCIGGVLHNQIERGQLYMVPRYCKTLSRGGRM